MFKFLEIELIGFTGMILNSIHRFQVTFNSPYMLLLGRNGSGKSRLIAMLNPLPPTKDDLLEGGLKRIRLEFKGEVYTIKTVYQKSLKSTIVNETTGETLIDNANPTVHANFVKQLFGWTKEINDVLTGNTLFTKMSVAERKKWFSLLSESDLTYALRFFKGAKERVRDLEGVRRHLNLSVSELQPRVIENADLLKLARESCDRLTADIDHINNVIRDINQRKPTTLPRPVDLLEQHIINVSNDILKTEYNPSNEDPYTELSKVQLRIDDALTKQRQLTDEYNKLDDRSKEYAQYAPEELQALQSSIREDKEKLKDLVIEGRTWDFGQYDTMTLKSSIEPAQKLLVKLFSLKDQVTSIVRMTEPLHVVHERQLVKVQICEGSCNKITHDIQNLTHYLKRADSEHSLNCPSCDFSFKPGYTATEIANAQKNLELLHKDVVVAAEELSAAREEYARLDQLMSVKQELQNLERYRDPYPPIGKMMDYYMRAIKEDDFTLEGKLNGFVEDLKVFYGHRYYTERIRGLEERYERGMSVMSGDAAKLQFYKDKVVGEMDAISERITVLKSEARILSANHEHYLRLAGNASKLDSLGAELADSRLLEHYTSMEAQCLEYRDNLYDRLTESRQRLNRMDEEAKKLENMTTDLERVERQSKAAKAVVKAISPEEGILSEYLHRSMTGITDLMTAYINSVWGYEMCVMPCDFSSGDLDYKFPFWVKDESNLVKDISKGSKAQQEVINFVFVLAVYRALNLDGYPLLLDEISSGFDEEHRPSMVDYVKSLIESEQHQQLIMVSHDASTHYRLTHADLCVLDPVGVTLPENYNEHVIIE